MVKNLILWYSILWSKIPDFQFRHWKSGNHIHFLTKGPEERMPSIGNGLQTLTRGSAPQFLFRYSLQEPQSKSEYFCNKLDPNFSLKQTVEAF